MTNNKEILELGVSFYDNFPTSQATAKCYCYRKKFGKIVIYDGKFLIIYDLNSKEEVTRKSFAEMVKGTRSLINMTYSEKLEAYFCVTEDFFIFLFDEYLKEVANIPFDYRFSQYLSYVDDLDVLIASGMNECQIYHLKSQKRTGHHKGMISQRLEVDVEDITELKLNLDWVKGLTVISNAKGAFGQFYSILVWSLSDIEIFGLPKGERLFRFPTLNEGDSFISQVVFSRFYRYFIIGFSTGSIKLWKLIGTKQLIYSFEIHKAQVLAIENNSEKRPEIFLSASSDQLILIWNIDSLACIYQIKFPLSIESISFQSSKIISIRDKNRNIMLGQLCFPLEFFTKTESKAICVSKLPVAKTNITMITICFENSTGISFNNKHIIEDVENTARKTQFRYVTIHPPPNFYGIKEIFLSPTDENLYYMYSGDGLICKYKLDDQNPKFEEVYRPSEIKTRDGKKLGSNPVTVNILNIVPARFDTESWEMRALQLFSSESNSKPAEIELETDPGAFIAMGYEDGVIIFVKTSNFYEAYTRLHFHKEAVQALDVIKRNDVQSGETSYLVSTSRKNEMIITAFPNPTYAVMVKRFRFPCKSPRIKIINDLLIVGLDQGVIEVFWLDEKQSLVTIRSKIYRDSTLNISSIDASSKGNIFLLVAENKLLLISREKHIIFQINLNFNVDSAFFLNDSFDIILSHEGKLSLLLSRYWSCPELLYYNKIDKKIPEKGDVLIGIEDYLQVYDNVMSGEQKEKSDSLIRRPHMPASLNEKRETRQGAGLAVEGSNKEIIRSSKSSSIRNKL